MGQHMIPFLIRHKYEVMALCRSEAAAQKVRAVGGIPIMDDLTSLSTRTASALEECEAVVHSAAYMDFNYESELFYQINVEATKTLLEMAESRGVKKFIYISAAPVVPGSPIENLTEDRANPGLPRDLYPKTKAIAERTVLAKNTPNFKTISLRPPAIWGPDNHHMEEVFERVKAGKWRWIGGSHQILSTIHIDNLSSAVIAALKSDLGGEAYFVTDGDRRSMRTTFSAIFKAHGLEPGNKEFPLGIAALFAGIFDFIWRLFRLKSRPPVPALAVRLMGREFSVSDQKARKELGYKNVIHFEEGVRALARSKSAK